MIDRLRSHLKSDKGFTLIELLVVIAIIAVLVVIVIIAINPIERLAEAADRRAASNVRSVATSVEACLAANAEDFTQCNTSTLLTNSPNQFVRNTTLVDDTTATTTAVLVSSSGSPVNAIALCQPGRTAGNGAPLYAHWSTSTGVIASNGTAC